MGQREVKDTIQHDHDQDQYIAIVLGLVDRDDEAEALHEDGEYEEASHQGHHR